MNVVRNLSNVKFSSQLLISVNFTNFTGPINQSFCYCQIIEQFKRRAARQLEINLCFYHTSLQPSLGDDGPKEILFQFLICMKYAMFIRVYQKTVNECCWSIFPYSKPYQWYFLYKQKSRRVNREIWLYARLNIVYKNKAEIVLKLKHSRTSLHATHHVYMVS